MRFIGPIVSATLVSSTNIHVPVTSDRYGHAIVEVDILGEAPSQHSLVISLASYIELASDHDLTGNGNIALSNTNISFLPDHYAVNSGFTMLGRLGELGINEHSDMVRQYQSLAVIKNHTHPMQFVVGITAEYFRSFCAEGSLKRLDRRGGFGNVEIADYTEPFNTLQLHISSYFYESALHLSASLGDRVRARLEASGAIANGPTAFTNCTYLPEDLALTLRFDSDGGDRISLFPDDYIEHDPIANTCSFYLSTRSNSFQPTDVVLNPLLVSGMNVRTTQGHFLEICDTSL